MNIHALLSRLKATDLYRVRFLCRFLLDRSGDKNESLTRGDVLVLALDDAMAHQQTLGPDQRHEALAVYLGGLRRWAGQGYANELPTTTWSVMDGRFVTALDANGDLRCYDLVEGTFIDELPHNVLAAHSFDLKALLIRTCGKEAPDAGDEPQTSA